MPAVGEGEEGGRGGGRRGRMAWAPLLSVKYCGKETVQITSQPFRKAVDTFSYRAHTEMCSIEFGSPDIRAMNLSLRSQTV